MRACEFFNCTVFLIFYADIEVPVGGFGEVEKRGGEREGIS